MILETNWSPEQQAQPVQREWLDTGSQTFFYFCYNFYFYFFLVNQANKSSANQNLCYNRFKKIKSS